jgi:hypothetical protein
MQTYIHIYILAFAYACGKVVVLSICSAIETPKEFYKSEILCVQ